MNKNKKLGFTLAEVLIVIGIIGVVAALTLPNLNHATGDKETVTRLQKAYSILSEANDRAVAIYGPISTWKSNGQCTDLHVCWMTRVKEFLKISKYCDEHEGIDISCEDLSKGDMEYGLQIYQLPDGITFSARGEDNCVGDVGYTVKDICINSIDVDTDGPNKGKNQYGKDIFTLDVSDSIGVKAHFDDHRDSFEDAVENCMEVKNCDCTFWVLEYSNLDYLKTDEEGKCNDSNIILDGTTNTSCH